MLGAPSITNLAKSYVAMSRLQHHLHIALHLYWPSYWRQGSQFLCYIELHYDPTKKATNWAVWSASVLSSFAIEER
jgi:hypothetical protein